MTTNERIRRGQKVIAMDTLAKCVNDERFYEEWLTLGVAEGDITSLTKPEDETVDCYCEDEEFQYLLTTFNRVMHKAWHSGGLYDGKVCSMDKAEWENYIKE